MKNFSYVAATIMALILAFPSFATKAASLQVSCKELLDLATYAEYFSSAITLREHESREFAMTSHMGGEASSTVRFTLLYLDSEAFMKVSWSNYFNGRLVESRSDQISVESNRPYEIELEARNYASSFRNSCTIIIK